eukprot:GSA120T00008884001.1
MNAGEDPATAAAISRGQTDEVNTVADQQDTYTASGNLPGPSENLLHLTGVLPTQMEEDGAQEREEYHTPTMLATSLDTGASAQLSEASRASMVPHMAMYESHANVADDDDRPTEPAALEHAQQVDHLEASSPDA